MRSFYLTAAASNNGSGGGNGVDSTCAPCGRSCGDSVYGTYCLYVDNVQPLSTSVHLLSE
jgi:hypothetical protein